MIFSFESVGNPDSIDRLTLLDQSDSIVKKWSLDVSHSVSQGAYWTARATHAHSVSLSYLYKDIRFSVSSSYVYPLGYVSDLSPFGLMDSSLSVSTPMKRFWNFKSHGSIGVSLPTSKKSLKKDKYFSLFGTFSYRKSLKKNLSFGISHTVYSSFYEYQTDISGNANRVASSSHKAYVAWNLKKWTISGQGIFYLYTYFADMNSKPDQSDIQLRWKASQGGHANVSYLVWPKQKMRLNAMWSLNIPVVSSVLTGFPIFDANYQLYQLGLSWVF